MVTSRGGTGIWAQVDHNEPNQVQSLFERVRQERGHLDILVNNMSGDQHLTNGMLSGKEPVSFWDCPIEKGLATQRNGVHTHLITSYYAAPLMIDRRHGLIIEITDGNRLAYNRVGVYHSLSKTSLVLLGYLMAEELKMHNVAVVSLTPGWLRSESMLDGFGVTEENWQDAVPENPDLADSETPFYIGRAVVALATDPNVIEKTGHTLSAGYLAREYGFSDVDGRQPPGYAWGGVDIREGVFKDGRFLSLEDQLAAESSKR